MLRLKRLKQGVRFSLLNDFKLVISSALSGFLNRYSQF